jgi:hypothetical protein
VSLAVKNVLIAQMHFVKTATCVTSACLFVKVAALEKIAQPFAPTVRSIAQSVKVFATTVNFV